MLSAVKDIMIISTPEDTHRFEELLGDGSRLGLNLSYKIQPSPDGLAQAFLLGEEFIGNDTVCMILGDNIFYGNGLRSALNRAVENSKIGKATIFGYHVEDPERFGVVEFNNEGKAISLEEKPKSPKSNYAVTGLYFYDNRVVKFAKKVKPSSRGELEITDLNRLYLEDGNLDVVTFGRGFTWLDTGTHESLAEATAFVKMIEDHQGLKISCPEEIAYKNGWISKEQLREQAELMKKNQYGKFLLEVLEGKVKY
jgi:glucose-1-phosphate thymidylyltransferase